MASFMSIGAYDHFENNDWYELEKDYEVITALDPYNAFYWDNGGWHLGWNAASWAKRNENFSPAKRRLFEMEYLEKGEAFYRKGLKFNPDSEKLWFDMGSMWSNEFKRPDLERAAEAFKMVRYSRNPVYRRRYLFTIIRIPGKEIEAYDEMTRLVGDGPIHFSIPKFRVLSVILASNPDLPAGGLRPQLHQVFRSNEVAYRDLYNYRARIKSEGYYPGNVDQLMKQLIIELDVPDSINPFVTEPKRPLYPSVWREELKKRDAGTSD